MVSKRSKRVLVADVKARCSYCMKAPGRKDVKTCGKCRLVRYCSKQCQEAAWGEHKKVCSSTLRQNLVPESDDAMLYELLTKWTNHWRDSLRRWALFALDTSNNPEDHLAKHVFVIELERRANPPSDLQKFQMNRGAVMTREQVYDILTDMEAPTENIEAWKNSHKGNNTICILILAEGMIRFLWQGLAVPDTGKSLIVNDVTNPEICAVLADHDLWEPCMIDTIKRGDVARTDAYLHWIVTKCTPEFLKRLRETGDYVL